MQRISIKASLALLLLLALSLGVGSKGVAAPKCEFIGPGGDYIDSLRDAAEAASEKGLHAKAMGLYATAAKYVDGCVEPAIADYEAHPSAGKEVDMADEMRGTMYGHAMALFIEAATQAKSGGLDTQRCAYARRALAAANHIEAHADRDSTLKPLLSGCGKKT